MARISTRVKIRTQDKGFNQLLSRLAQINGELKVGVLPEEGAKRHPNADTTVAQVAAWHEFGTPSIPQRSWLRGWFDSVGQAEMAKILTSGARDVVRNPRTALGVFAGIDKGLVASIKRRIVARIPPPLSTSTVAAKGHDTPLIDTGTFINSIGARFETKRGRAARALGSLGRLFGRGR